MSKRILMENQTLKSSRKLHGVRKRLKARQRNELIRVVHGYIFSAELRYSSPGFSSLNSRWGGGRLTIQRRVCLLLNKVREYVRKEQVRRKPMFLSIQAERTLPAIASSNRNDHHLKKRMRQVPERSQKGFIKEDQIGAKEKYLNTFSISDTKIIVEEMEGTLTVVYLELDWVI